MIRSYCVVATLQNLPPTTGVPYLTRKFCGDDEEEDAETIAKDQTPRFDLGGVDRHLQGREFQMKKKEKLILSLPSASSVDPVKPDSRIPAEDRRKDKASLDEGVAKSLERSIRWITCIPFNFSPVEVLNVSTKADRLVVSVQTDLYLPEPPGDSGEWLGTRKELSQFRRDFEKHLTLKFLAKNRQILSNILHSEFDLFVRSIICTGNQDVMSRIPKTTERKGAGRPRTKIDPDTLAAVEARSLAIRPGLKEIRIAIQRWKVTNLKLDDEQCKDKLRKEYSDRFDWLPIFLEIGWGNRTTIRKGDERSITICDLTTWSAVVRANLIALEEYRRRTRQPVSLRTFQRQKAGRKRNLN
jgi:hypothetical protein